MFTPLFDRFVEPARARAQLWRLVLGFILIAAVYLAGLALIFALLRLFFGRERTFALAVEITEATTPAGMLLLFASFLGAAIAPMIVVRLLHRRPVGTLFGPRVRVVRDFAIAAATVMVIYSALLLLLSFWFTPLPNLTFTLWLTLLPLTIAGLLIQTGAEELIFRSYLLQQLAARFRSPLFWLFLPSLIFAALHYDPATSGDNTWLVIGAAGLFGLVAADLTRITGSIGAAWGFHFANNLWAVDLLAVDGGLTGVSLFVTSYNANDTSILPLLISGDLATMALAWFVLRRLLQR